MLRFQISFLFERQSCTCTHTQKERKWARGSEHFQLQVHDVICLLPWWVGQTKAGSWREVLGSHHSFSYVHASKSATWSITCSIWECPKAGSWRQELKAGTETRVSSILAAKPNPALAMPHPKNAVQELSCPLRGWTIWCSQWQLCGCSAAVP